MFGCGRNRRRAARRRSCTQASGVHIQGEPAALFLGACRTKAKRIDSSELRVAAEYVPALVNRKAEAVTRAEVAYLHGQIGDRPYRANRLLAVIGSLCTFAERRGLVPESCNPGKKIEKFSEDRRERFLTPEELERLGAAIREEKRSASLGARAALRRNQNTSPKKKINEPCCRPTPPPRFAF